MIRLPPEERRRERELKQELRALLKPHKDAGRKERRATAKDRERKVGKRAQGQRQPRERDPGFLAYLRRQPCEAAHIGGCEGPIQAAHIRFGDARHGQNPGAGRKNHDRNANPLCEAHHLRDQHAGAERAFWERLGKDAYDTAAGHFAAYREGGR
jgi:hypothetical protein